MTFTNRVRRFLRQPRVRSGGLTVIALLSAGGIIARGPLLDGTSKRPLESVISREVATVVPAVRWDLPNLDHAMVDAWVTRLSGPMKSSVATYMKRMERYEPMIAEKAQARGVPVDLVYLAMIESGGNPTALSPVKARGLWQFMSPTARDYGLTVRGNRDDRIDPARATDAALDYLSDLHRRFGSWYLAAAAYNTGQGRVARILKEVTGRSTGTDEDFYRIASRLPKETRDYVPKLIAVARIAKEPGRYGLTPAYLANASLTEARVTRKKVTPKGRAAPAKRAAAKKPVVKKSTSVAKKSVAKKSVAKKSVAKKTVAKKPVAKKRTVAKKPVAKKRVVATAKRPR